MNPGLPAGPAVGLWLVTPRAPRGTPKVSAVWERLEARLAELE